MRLFLVAGRTRSGAVYTMVASHPQADPRLCAPRGGHAVSVLSRSSLAGHPAAAAKPIRPRLSRRLFRPSRAALDAVLQDRASRVAEVPPSSPDAFFAAAVADAGGAIAVLDVACVDALSPAEFDDLDADVMWAYHFCRSVAAPLARLVAAPRVPPDDASRRLLAREVFKAIEFSAPYVRPGYGVDASANCESPEAARGYLAHVVAALWLNAGLLKREE